MVLKKSGLSDEFQKSIFLNILFFNIDFFFQLQHFIAASAKLRFLKLVNIGQFSSCTISCGNIQMFKRTIYFLVVLSLHCFLRAFSTCGKQGLLFVAVHGLLIVTSSLAVEHRLQVLCVQQLWPEDLVAPQHLGSFKTRDPTCVPCIGRQTLIHYITREVLAKHFLKAR